MQTNLPSPSDDLERPKVLHVSRSFTRLEPSTLSLSKRNRSSTTLIPEILLSQDTVISPGADAKAEKGDIFIRDDDDDDSAGMLEDNHIPSVDIPEGPSDLPIEIRSLTERFLESLSVKAHPTPLSIDTVSGLFQDFYIRASSHIATHIATLSSRISRGNSSHPSSFKGAAPNALQNEQQMLTASEIFDRRKARRMLELKRVALEEAVEKAACEKIYDRIWRHKSTDDEERDEKLQSRIAALSVVGIGLKELLVSSEEITDEIRQAALEKENDIREWLSEARSNLQKMDAERYPLGKLQQLIAAHKRIVETLSRIFPSSSSADEILPTLIYALLTSPEGVNAVSNFNFIQRFRASSKVDGEAAYCLVNLEAAISFLETVDLPSLRADEMPEGPDKYHSRPITPNSGSTSPANTLATIAASNLPKLGISDLSVKSSQAPVLNPKSIPSPTRSQRRLSTLIQAQTSRLEAASDAVRGSILDGADQAFDTINTTLESSFKFLFGRLREQQVNVSLDGKGDVILPKTLEDARKLVSTQLSVEDNASIGVSSSITDEEPRGVSESRATDLFGGRHGSRDRSADSSKSGGSGKRLAVLDAHLKEPTPTSAHSPSNAAVESMRSLGNSLNPLNRIVGIPGMIPRFGRSATNTPPPNASSTETKPAVMDQRLSPKEVRWIAAVEELRKTAPPIKRFLDLKDAKDLKIGEVEELLKDYQRLATALKHAIIS